MPNGLKTIEYGTFFACKKLKQLEIPDSVELIASESIDSCVALKDIFIPENVKNIGKHAIVGCKKVVVHGKIKSEAQKYAKKEKIPFEEI